MYGISAGSAWNFQEAGEVMSLIVTSLAAQQELRVCVEGGHTHYVVNPNSC